MEQSTLRAFEAQCIQEEPPACESRCPLHVDARSLARLIAEGKTGDARKLLDRVMPLSALLGLLCEGPCLERCRRGEVDASVNIPLLERACVAATRSMKPMPMPATGKFVAVAGAGLSSLTAAFELGRKGHAVTVFHMGPVGGRLRVSGFASFGGETVGEAALAAALEQLAAVRVQFREMKDFTASWLAEALAPPSPDNPGYGAVYLGLDDAPVGEAAREAWQADLPGIGTSAAADALTLGMAHPRVFAGGMAQDSVAGTASGPATKAASFIQEAADGKRAAGSIDRLLQGVSPSTAREKEGPVPCLLYTDISRVPPAPPVTPANPATPTLEEARAEAARCIRCECMECVKRCPYLAAYKGYPKKYARQVYNNLAVLHGLRLANTQINSCAQCGLCAAVCPHGADMGAFCGQARREMVQARRMPPSAHDFALLDMEYSNAPDIAFLRPDPAGKDASAPEADAWLFFPGCQLPASLPEHTERLYAHLRQHLPGGVGLFFHCCGAPAAWSGRELLTGSVAGGIRQSWTDAGRPVIILACASCTAFFKEHLGGIPVRALWDILAELPLPDGARKAEAPLALHDPCATRKEDATRASVRGLLQQLGQPVEELSLGRERTRCCGYGGLASAANPAMGGAYAKSRAEDTDNSLLAYCIMCRDRLRAVGKPALHLLDLLFPGPENPEQAAGRPAPGISARQRSRLDFRRHMLHTVWNEPAQEDTAMEAMVLHIPDDLARTLEERRIRHADIKAVLRHAEAEGPLFVNRETGRSLASLRPRQTAFWVEYAKQDDGSYVIHDAYCHRMVVPGVPGEGASTPATGEGCAVKAVWG